MAQPREKELHELLSRDMVDIYVGADNTHWILHEKLLCARSKFFTKIFYGPQAASRTTRFGLPDDDAAAFRLFVGWLYSDAVPAPAAERELGRLFDLYLMGERWQCARLVRDVLDAVRAYYRRSRTYPALRRVQYVYANTVADSPMRRLLVAAVARMLALGEGGLPPHWDRALRGNGQLAVDIIGAVRGWRLADESVPDARTEVLEGEEVKVRLVEKAERSLTVADVEKKLAGAGVGLGSESDAKEVETTDGEGEKTLFDSGEES